LTDFIQANDIYQAQQIGASLGLHFWVHERDNDARCHMPCQ